MKSKHNLIQPNTLEVGGQYYYIEDPKTTETRSLPEIMRRVIFVAYDVCPAIVIVRNGSNKRWRCLRHHLFTDEHSN